MLARPGTVPYDRCLGRIAILDRDACGRHGGQGRSVNAATWLGRTTLKWRRCGRRNRGVDGSEWELARGRDELRDAQPVRRCDGIDAERTGGEVAEKAHLGLRAVERIGPDNACRRLEDSLAGTSWVVWGVVRA